MANQIKVTNITNGTLVNNQWVGTGVFDVLMNAVNSNIESQYQSGRLTSTEYATVYLGSMQSVIQQSVQYTLSEPMAEEELKQAYIKRVAEDKKAAMLGMDNVMKNNNATVPEVYAPKYKEL